MSTRIHPKNVHEKSPKKCPQKVTQKEDFSWTLLSTRCHQKCLHDVTPFVHEKSCIMSTRCLPPVFLLTGLLYTGILVRVNFSGAEKAWNIRILCTNSLAHAFSHIVWSLLVTLHMKVFPTIKKHTSRVPGRCNEKL